MRERERHEERDAARRRGRERKREKEGYTENRIGEEGVRREKARARREMEAKSRY